MVLHSVIRAVFLCARSLIYTYSIALFQQPCNRQSCYIDRRFEREEGVVATAEVGTIPIYNIMKKNIPRAGTDTEIWNPNGLAYLGCVFYPYGIQTLRHWNYANEICKNAGNAYGHYHSSTFLLSKSQWLGVFGCVFPLYIEETSSWLRPANEIWKIAHFQPRAGTLRLVGWHRPLSIFHRFSAGWRFPTKSQRSLDLAFPRFSSFFLTFCRLGPLIFGVWKSDTIPWLVGLG